MKRWIPIHVTMTNTQVYSMSAPNTTKYFKRAMENDPNKERNI